ncbi:ABC transporter permease subunit [Escherichia coli]
MKLLIVEDEKKTGEYLTKGLTEAGFVVDLADNGLNGYHLAMTGDYDLIILDIMLPDVNGWDIVRMLRSANKGMPILLLTALGIYDTEMALIITMVTQTLPTAVFMLKSYFDTIPDEIEEAAMMDGLNRLQIIFRITVPLAMSGLISVFVYCFMVAWNDYLFASIFLSSASNFTLPVGLNALFSTPDYIWGRMMAASLVTALPVVIMYALSERFIKSGLTAGGVKG